MSEKLIISTGDTFKNTLRGDRSQAVATITKVTDQRIRFKYATGVIDEVEMSLFEKLLDNEVFTDYKSNRCPPTTTLTAGDAGKK